MCVCVHACTHVWGVCVHGVWCMDTCACPCVCICTGTCACEMEGVGLPRKAWGAQAPET